MFTALHLAASIASALRLGWLSRRLVDLAWSI